MTARAPAPERIRRERLGRFAEHCAVLLLTVKGYRVLARRHRSRLGEIDIIAVRGRRLAFIEVKARASIVDGQSSIGGRQASRIVAAAEQWVWRHPGYRDYELGFDAILIVGGLIPHHLPNALQPI